MAAVLDINDAGLLVHQDGSELLESPGFITHEKKSLHVGIEGAARVKLMPTQTQYGFWEKFSTDTLEQAHPVAATQADLAFRHLEHLWSVVGKELGELIICVPSDFSRQQLGLLLGIARHVGMPVRALVDAAVAGSHQPVPGRQLFHLDVHLHRTVITGLDQGPWLTRAAAQSSQEFSLLRLQDAWSEAVAQVFVQSTRFDPMHTADTEQQMFDRMSGWLSLLSDQDETELELSHGDQRFSARLQRRTMLKAVDPLYRRLLDFVAEQLPEGKPVTLQVAHRLAHLPGAMSALQTLPDVDLVVLSRTATADGVSRLYLDRNAPADAEVPMVTRLPWFKSTDLASHSEQLAGYRRRQPTHLLHQAVAHPLDLDEFWVGSELGQDQQGIHLAASMPGIAGRHFRLRRQDGELVLEDLSGGATVLNEKPLEGRREVAIGDRIRIGSPGTEFMLISVAEHGA
ncbi:MAG: FHA domain-containing protein [Xanthomonadales bacterium]|nr:FHA domain-containing protein [Xanthomonadales bacterium]